MVTPITLECPHCRQVADVYLSADATFVILNCPGCLRHLIYHDNTCAILNRQQVHHLMHAHHDGNVEQMLIDIVKRARDRLWLQARSVLPQVSSLEKSVAVQVETRAAITEDDVLNLRIMLESCRDSAEFLAHV